jgi:hypothetical protein
VISPAFIVPTSADRLTTTWRTRTVLLRHAGIAEACRPSFRRARVPVAAILNEERQVLMMWRYRFLPGRFGWELPGARIPAVPGCSVSPWSAEGLEVPDPG